MENALQTPTDPDIIALREDIKRTYHAYTTRDHDRFPQFDYNTNRANYEPLRSSFEEEFYVIRGLDRTNTTIHIPSTNTLALLFTDSTYVPGRKILNTCRSYAHGRPIPTGDESAPYPAKHTGRNRVWWYIVIGMFTLIAVAGSYTMLHQTPARIAPSKLTISYPLHGQTVPRRPFVAGRVANADTVWVVVRPVTLGGKCYVQPPIPVKKDGTWRGQVFIGGLDPLNIGQAFEIRAFVNPPSVYRAIEEEERDVFNEWPNDAELATHSTVVIRGPELEKPAK
ncbi:hypothetical protein CLV58_11789 [Spirosoma oryzae]|uniref:Uncharacterized protein n=1 Tax=Spirosoma oryzae TaxID=1469603 RepID=A0A2T0SM60_9BACT|nr:hypothetical protein [Spirosoma oryzae]PRY34485.1 hypothetical protein CLV58_11789 [Spirosoma oryzae]